MSLSQKSPSRLIGPRSWVLVAAAATSWMWATVTDAQPTDNDYYATSRDDASLMAVEKYHLHPGEEKLRARHYDAAFEDFVFILNYFPNHPQALLLMAQLCATWKSPKCSADAYFERAVARNPEASSALITYGVYLARYKRYSAAIGVFNRALEIDPNSTSAHYNIALAFLDNRQFDLANEHAQKAYALGAAIPGLRDRLQRAGQWKPSAVSASPPAGGSADDAAEKSSESSATVPEGGRAR